MSHYPDDKYLNDRDRSIQKEMVKLKRKLLDLTLLIDRENNDDNDDSIAIQGEQPSVPCAITNLPLFKIMAVLFYIDKLLGLTSVTERIKWDSWNDSPFAEALLERFDLAGHKWDVKKIRGLVKTYFDKIAKRCRLVLI